MKDISDLEFMINSLYKKWKYHVGHTYEWQKKNEAMFNDIVARLEALERRTYESDEGGCDEGTFDPEPCQQIPTDEELSIDDLDEFTIYWWGPDVDGKRSLADAIESGRMSEFVRTVLTRY